MSGFDQSSIAVSMPTVVGADAALGGPYKIKPSEAFSGALMTVSGLTGETISVETSPDGYWGAPASPTFYRTDWQGTQQLYPVARTNYVFKSADLSTTWGKLNCVVTADATTAPDGTTTADEMADNATLGYHTATANAYADIPVASNSLACASAYFKNVDARSGIVQISTKVPLYPKVVFDLVNGTMQAVGTLVAYGMQNMGNGWWRCWIVANVGTGASPVGMVVGVDASGTSAPYAGTGKSIFIWGAQFEAGSAPTSYIPTGASAATVTDYTISNGVITLAEAPVTGATLSYDNSVLPSPYYIFATGDGVRTQFAYDGVWGTLSANSAKGNGIWQVDLRGAQAYRLVKSAGSETATVNMTLKRDALQYKNTAGTWSVT